MNRGKILQEVKEMVLWSLLLEEEEKQDLLKRVKNYTDEQLVQLLDALKVSQEREEEVFDTLGEIDPEFNQKVKTIVKNEKKKMLGEAEKKEKVEEGAEELLKEL
jgi:hypothetical protein